MAYFINCDSWEFKEMNWFLLQSYKSSISSQNGGPKIYSSKLSSVLSKYRSSLS